MGLGRKPKQKPDKGQELWQGRQAALLKLFCVFLCLSLPFLLKNSASNRLEEAYLAQEEAKLLAQTEAKAKAREKEGEEREKGQKETLPTPAPVSIIRDASFFQKNLKEKNIYTFLQGPQSWSAKADWSGEWCQMVLGGQNFSVFGCGLCDLANIYSTLTPYECSPVDMFEYARQVTAYSPSSAAGAIDWNYLKETLETVGIKSKLCRKDSSYAKFQKAIRKGITAIVLVNSANDATYWPSTSGHYVNIWKYDKKEDTVFLGDSGNMYHNRQRIPLRYVYDALSTSSGYQYLLVTEVDEAANTWEHNGIAQAWNAP